MALLGVAGSRLAGQSRPDSARCDSIVAHAAAVDSVATAIFVSVAQLDGDWMSPERRDLLESRISRFFVAPRPFRLSVFDGPSLVRGLRISSAGDSVGVPRVASILGDYRVELTDRGSTDGPRVLRSSLLPGFDSAVVTAIRSAARAGRALRPESGDQWRLEVRISTDSIDQARRIAQGVFPRVRVRDASPLSRQRPAFPAGALNAGFDHGEVVLRFIVDRDGKPALETVELVRATSFEFARAAIVALGAQTFNAATIRGCPVAQLVEFPFVFDTGDRPPP